MPRTRKCTTNRRSYSEKQVKQAVILVVEEVCSLRSASTRLIFELFVDKSRNVDFNSVNFRPKNEHLLVFTYAEEIELRDYILRVTHIHHDLSSKQFRSGKQYTLC